MGKPKLKKIPVPSFSASTLEDPKALDAYEKQVEDWYAAYLEAAIEIDEVRDDAISAMEEFKTAVAALKMTVSCAMKISPHPEPVEDAQAGMPRPIPPGDPRGPDPRMRGMPNLGGAAERRFR